MNIRTIIWDFGGLLNVSEPDTLCFGDALLV